MDTRFLIWYHYEDVIQLIHLHHIGLTMSVAPRGEDNITGSVNSLKVSEMSMFGCHKKLTPSSIYWEK